MGGGTKYPMYCVGSPGLVMPHIVIPVLSGLKQLGRTVLVDPAV